MKFLSLCALCAVALAAPREKRQLAIGTISVSGAGGQTGCVVTGNVLYANGIKLRELTSAEQTELTTYEADLQQYKTQIKDVINQRRENLKSRLTAARRGEDNEVETSTAGSENLPQAPKKPSFCTAEDTTQYIFDGCMVQGNKVYVGGQYARDLSSDEVTQLKEFDVQQTAYQNAVQKQMQSQVRGLFGGSDFLSALFGEDGAGPRTGQKSVGTTAAAPEDTSLPPKPNVPNFCVAIF